MSLRHRDSRGIFAVVLSLLAALACSQIAYAKDNGEESVRATLKGVVISTDGHAVSGALVVFSGPVWRSPWGRHRND